MRQKFDCPTCRVQKGARRTAYAYEKMHPLQANYRLYKMQRSNGFIPTKEEANKVIEVEGRKDAELAEWENKMKWYKKKSEN